jgi:hypothetical protein
VERAPVRVAEGPAELLEPEAPLTGALHLEVEDRVRTGAARQGDAASLHAVLSGGGLVVRVELARPLAPLPGAGGAPDAAGGASVARGPGEAGVPAWGRVRAWGVGRVLVDGREVAGRARVAVGAAVDVRGGAPGAPAAQPGVQVLVEGVPDARFPGGRLRFTLEEGVLLSYGDGAVLMREGVLVAERDPGVTPEVSIEGDGIEAYGGAGEALGAPDAAAPSAPAPGAPSREAPSREAPSRERARPEAPAGRGLRL